MLHNVSRIYIDAMVESSPKLLKATVAYENEVSDMIISHLVALADGESEPSIGIDPMIEDNYILACEDTGGEYYFFIPYIFSCVVDSSGEEFTITPLDIVYCEAPTEACDDEDVWLSLLTLGIEDVPGYECVRLDDGIGELETTDDSDDVVDVPASGGNVVFGEGDCDSDIFAMVEISPELAQATVDYNNEINDSFKAALESLLGEKDDFVGIDPMIRENYILACEDAGGRNDPQATPYGCFDSSGNTYELTPRSDYCKAKTEACDDVDYFTDISVDNVPGFECVLLIDEFGNLGTPDSDDGVEVQTSGSNVLNWTNDSLMMIAGSLFVTLFNFIS